ncbi:putative activation/secretion signal peptide protein [Burkholderia cenocepacia H111]|nr:putative activation/secretion signal peptide protein [Burkholderia cenocepacia H111]
MPGPHDAALAHRTMNAATRRAGCVAATLLVTGFAHAQVPVPSAGQSIRDIEAAPPSLPAAARPDIDLPPVEPPPAPAHDAGPRVAVRGFAIEGNTVIATERLQALLVEFMHRDLSFAELQQAASRITHYYRERGYVLARAYLPRQDIDDGTIRIAIVEGRYGKIDVQNHSRVLDAPGRRPTGRRFRITGRSTTAAGSACRTSQGSASIARPCPSGAFARSARDTCPCVIRNIGARHGARGVDHIFRPPGHATHGLAFAQCGHVLVLSKRN